MAEETEKLDLNPLKYLGDDVRLLRELYRDHTQLIVVSLTRIEGAIQELNSNIRHWVETGRSLIRLARWIVLAATLAIIASLGQTMSLDVFKDGIRIRRNVKFYEKTPDLAPIKPQDEKVDGN